MDCSLLPSLNNHPAQLKNTPRGLFWGFFADNLILSLLSYLLVIFSLSISSLTTSPLHAQENIQINHNQPKYEDVPSPGELLKLTVSLQGTREVHPHIKIIMLMDGKLIEYPLGTGKLNIKNEPEFEVYIPAPEIDLSYQFILPATSTSILSSPQYTFKRQCSENKILTNFPIKESDEVTLFKSLSQAAADLEYEVRLYRVADELLQKIKASMRNVPSEDGE